MPRGLAGVALLAVVILPIQTSSFGAQALSNQLSPERLFGAHLSTTQIPVNNFDLVLASRDVNSSSVYCKTWVRIAFQFRCVEWEPIKKKKK